MKARAFLPKFCLVLVSMFLLASCRLPGMIPLTPIPAVPMPAMEKDGQVHLEKLKGTDWVYLQSLAEERYTEADFARPGTLMFTVKITDDTPTYFDYAWCTTTEEILKQNFEHISVSLYFNEQELGPDVVHPVFMFVGSNYKRARKFLMGTDQTMYSAAVWRIFLRIAGGICVGLGSRLTTPK